MKNLQGHCHMPHQNEKAKKRRQRLERAGSNLFEHRNPRINSQLANCSQRGLPIGPLHALPTYRSPGGSQESDSPIGENHLKIRGLYTEGKK